MCIYGTWLQSSTGYYDNSGVDKVIEFPCSGVASCRYWCHVGLVYKFVNITEYSSCTSYIKAITMLCGADLSLMMSTLFVLKLHLDTVPIRITGDLHHVQDLNSWKRCWLCNAVVYPCCLYLPRTGVKHCMHTVKSWSLKEVQVHSVTSSLILCSLLAQDSIGESSRSDSAPHAEELPKRSCI